MVLPVDVDATWVNPSAVQYNAQELRRADSTIFNGDGASGVRGGVVRHSDSSLLVTVNGSDVVTVQPGAVVIPGNSGVGNGCYRTALGAAETGNLAARNATNPRIDLVVFRAMDTDVVGGHGAYTGRVEIITGTPASSPVAPSLPVLAVELARITVPPTAGGAGTVDSTYRTYAVGAGGRVPVSTFNRLPAVASKWERAILLDTGSEYYWDGTAWIADVSGPSNPSYAANVAAFGSAGSKSYTRSRQGSFNLAITATANLAAGASLCTLVAGHRPLETWRFAAVNFVTASPVLIHVEPTGLVVSDTAIGNGNNVFGSVTFPI